MAGYTRDTEIRQVQFSLLDSRLIKALEDDWRKLFYMIPMRIEDIGKDLYPLKYNGSQESELDEYAASQNEPFRVLVLLEEWGTSGKRDQRPTLGHLLTLATKARMLRAAELLAVLLRLPVPERPSRGPAAVIDVEQDIRDMETHLNGVSYPNSSALQNGPEDTLRNNLYLGDPSKRYNVADSMLDGRLPSLQSRSDNNQQSAAAIPLLSGLLNVQAGPSGLTNNVPLISLLGVTQSSTSDSVSEAINLGFGQSVPVPSGSMNGLPLISLLGGMHLSASHSASETNNSSFGQSESRMDSSRQNLALPSIQEDDETSSQSTINNSSDSMAAPSAGAGSYAGPALSMLQGNMNVAGPSSVLRQNSELLPMVLPHSNYSTNAQAAEVPCLSIFNRSVEIEQQAGSPNVPGNSTDSLDLPRFSQLAPSEELSVSMSPSSTNSTSHVSPLINFPYSKLKSATAHFDERSFTNRNLSDPDGRIVGRGGFGDVFLGLNLMPTIAVAAVKRLFPKNHKYREKFNKEVEILSRCSHPNIVKLLGYSEDDQLCLVYEYLPDGNLEAVLESCRRGTAQLKAAQRLSYLVGIAAALEYLHGPEVNVIHRDVKLANVLLEGNMAKLCDFGLMKQAAAVTRTEVSGTGPYMAPEVLRGTVSQKQDIYAFGIIIAEVVTGDGVLSGVASGTGDLLERVNARGANLENLVDRKVGLEEVGKWIVCGQKLLRLAKDCLQDSSYRPKAEKVLKDIQEAQQILLN